MKQAGTVEWRSVGKTHVGAVRTLNEDAILDRPEQGIWAVADGMGGHEAGDKASISVVTALAMVNQASSLSELIGDATARLRTVNDALGADKQAAMVGTTVVALMSQGTHVAVLWAGDSRAYLFRNGQLQQLTLDHSRVQELIDHGLIAPQDAHQHPEANVITRAIGVSPQVEFDTKIIEAAPGDTYLLCSDGLYRDVAESDIMRCLKIPGCSDACQQLISKALEGGGNDNISVIVIRPGLVDPTARNLAVNKTAERDEDLTTLDLTRLPDSR